MVSRWVLKEEFRTTTFPYTYRAVHNNSISPCSLVHTSSSPATSKADSSLPNQPSTVPLTSTSIPQSPGVLRKRKIAQQIHHSISPDQLPFSTSPVHFTIDLSLSKPSTIHPMITRSKAGIHKPKMFLSQSLHDLDFKEPLTAKAAFTHAKWNTCNARGN